MTTWNSEIYIGTIAGGVDGMVKVSSLGADSYAPAISEGAFTVDPASFPVIVRTGDGTEIEHGFLQTIWHINGLRGSQYDALKAYRTGHSTPVYIRTLKPDGDDYANYLADMIWPPRINRGDPTSVEDGGVFDFELHMINMIEQT